MLSGIYQIKIKFVGKYCEVKNEYINKMINDNLLKSRNTLNINSVQ